ncbi:hypothetical protein Cob_v008686 [Colletotrichum orbiculare MAFF 240422]|uniref:Uncharacterized protein n=1 Tax=Colletotrichum orbiculare (strain 104-T / ATCC 96160 / CBS 514.97 / LARS 414 / MAFF 240422) TaxID=1213857 RepID=A0A484FNH6_COLOR|nr:hypothetical protein Cob_v008686 [Colletotrichum orbiculare MAFF 240422]
MASLQGNPSDFVSSGGQGDVWPSVCRFLGKPQVPTKGLIILPLTPKQIGREGTVPLWPGERILRGVFQNEYTCSGTGDGTPHDLFRCHRLASFNNPCQFPQSGPFPLLRASIPLNSNQIVHTDPRSSKGAMIPGTVILERHHVEPTSL